MASFDFIGLQDIVQQMERMGQLTSPVAEEMVTAAAEEIRDGWKQTAEEYGLVDTGAMVESVSMGPGPLKAGGVFYREVYPQGKDAKGTDNAEKAFILHYGKSGFPATYWADAATEKAADKAYARMEEIWNRFLETGGG